MSSIRNISLGIPLRSGHVLVLDGTDSVTGENFHRLIGGGIEFGETAEAALRREFAEELGVTLGSVELLEVVENIFEFEGLLGHEIVHVFAVDSADIDAFSLDVHLRVLDEGSPVHWVLAGGTDRPIYPAEVARIINALVQ
ncbi:NUDIX domain-containing protein [Rhodococcus sp. NPDC056506]|uniref:NUDIX domain-containing protein n=1 Tax=Rhodococcus sp. NPDC056506 TaxID=3345844 RepID=UPI00366C3AA3